MLQARGTRIRSTTQAAAVVAAMSTMPAFRSARDIRDAVRRDGGQVGIATVYRHLRVLTEQGVVDTLRGAGGEVLYRLRHGSLTHHITCRACRARRRGRRARGLGMGRVRRRQGRVHPLPGARSNYPACAPRTQGA